MIEIGSDEKDGLRREGAVIAFLSSLRGAGSCRLLRQGRWDTWGEGE